MPIFDITVVEGHSGPLPDDAAAQLADALGTALGAATGSAWVRLHRLDERCYAENNVARSAMPRPVFVLVTLADEATLVQRREQAVTLAAVVAGVLRRSADDVHIEFAAPARGRIAFGGTLLS